MSSWFVPLTVKSGRFVSSGHIAEDHPDDYPIVMAALSANAIGAPHFIGQDPKQTDNFVMITRVSIEGGGVLVAVALEPDEDGFYAVRSGYIIPERKLTERQLAGRLKRTPSK
jgi:hypothetical protein